MNNPTSLINPVKLLYLLTKEIFVNVLHKLIKHRKRSNGLVTKDYDQGEWLDIYNSKAWVSVDSLEDYIIPRDFTYMYSIVDRRYVKINKYNYYTYRSNKLVEILKLYAGDQTEIFEVGSGAGKNLFTLSLKGDWKKITGLELSEVGISVTNEVIKRFSIKNISVDNINLLDKDSPNFSMIKGKFVFTYYCLEQLPNHVELVIKNLVASGVKRVVHVEPSLELYNLWSLKDLSTISYVWRQNYLNNLVTIVKKLESQGLVRIIDVKRLGFSPGLRNDPTLVVWEPV
jgi:hypothetical protein